MNALLLQQCDYVLLVVGTLSLFACIHFRFWRGRSCGSARLITWSLVLAVLGSGWFWVENSTRREQARMRQMVEAYAPTYAQELGLMGHQEITPESSPEEPRYWRMITAQKRWLAANSAINDIYTLRKLPDGRIARIVDSETDFNRNGALDEAREQRAKIGDLYQGALVPAVEKALAGNPVFLMGAESGASVSAVVPIPGFRGDVEAALAVDFTPALWVAALQHTRLMNIGSLAAILLVIAGAAGVLARQFPVRSAVEARDLSVPPAAQEEAKETIDAPSAPQETKQPVVGQKESSLEPSPQTEATIEPGEQKAASVEPHGQNGTNIERQKLETLIDSIDGIVWEADAKTFDFNFVSRQSERLLGYTPEQWMAEENFWRNKLHPKDQWANEYNTRMVAAKVPYSYKYRMIAADGRTVWIQESAAVMLDEAGEPLLVRGVFYDVTEQKRAAEELEQANAALVDSSRYAGMAEVATGVLHNVGNVLNSVNISGSVISDRLRGSKVIELGKVAGLLTLQAADFAGFVARDPRGPHIPELISRVAEALRAEHADLLEEVDAITRNITHIKEIVSMQQGFAKGKGIVEPVAIQTLVDDAIKINSDSMTRHRITVVQAFEEVPKVLVDKHLVLQILVNLLRNAKQAIQESGREERRIVVRIQGNGGQFVKIAIQDTGNGIPAENLTRIFSHGFTTKKTGHGFGLHSSALAATGMGGALSAYSDGPGTGAIFSLDLPVFNPTPVAVAA